MNALPQKKCTETERIMSYKNEAKTQREITHSTGAESLFPPAKPSSIMKTRGSGNARIERNPN